MEFQPGEENLRHLRDWIAKSPHIVQDYDDQLLTAIVRGCKGSLQKTKTVLENLNSLGQKYPGIMKNYDPFDQPLAEYLSEATTFVLPKKSSDGSTILMFGLRCDDDFKNDPFKFRTTEYFRYWIISIYTLFWRNDFGDGKFTLICDLKMLEMTHARELTPMLFKHVAEILQNTLPIRIQAIHVLNMPPFIEYVFNLAKSMLKKKIYDRVYCHKTMETFYKQCPKEILPMEYGGFEEKSLILHEQWRRTVESFSKKFSEEESKMRRLDSIRPKAGDLQEMAGTFKALNLD